METVQSTSSIIQHTGSLLDVNAGIIVHGCNAQGVMGAGVAKAVRSKYPKAYQSYRDHYNRHGLKVGQIIPVTVKQSADNMPTLIIVNAITQEFTGTDRIQVDYVGLGHCFEEVAMLARSTTLEVHFPLIGCGLAGGQWSEVAPRIEHALRGIPAHLWVL